MTRAVVGVVLFIVALGFGIVAGLRAVFGGLFDGLPTDKLADLATVAVLFAVGVVLLVRSGDWMGAVIWRGRQSAPRIDAPAIDATWRERISSELPTYTPPTPVALPPARVRVPVFSAMGRPQPIGAQPIGAQSGDVVLETTAADESGRPVTLEVPYRYLLRFASLPTPARSEWTGKPQLFYQCQKFFSTHGFMRPEGQTLVWRDEYPLESRRQWLYQFEPGAQPCPTPADVVTASE